jgi:hypothetical protein
MNLVDELKKMPGIASKKKIVRYVGNDRRRFDALMKVFLGSNYRLTQWAGWPMSDLVKQHPGLIAPYLRPILKNIDKPGMHVAVKRNVLRMFQFIEIPKNIRGLAFDKAFRLFADTSEPIAVRVFAMQVMSDVAMDESELKNEVIIAIEEQLPFGSPAFKNRGMKLIRKLKR